MHEAEEIPRGELTEDDRSRLAEAATLVFAELPWVVAAWHFGSSTDNSKRPRDVDVGILAASLPEKLSITDRLVAELTKHSRIDTIPLDVRFVNEADPVFLGRFLSSAVLIYEADRRARIEWEARAMALWLDYRPIWERARKAALGAWAHG